MTKQEYLKQWREKNKESIKIKQREYHIKNRERIKKQVSENGKKWYQKNKERNLERGRRWQKNNRKRAVEIVQKYVRNNKEKVNEYRKKYGLSLEGYYRRYKYRAKKAGFEMLITLKDFNNITTLSCSYCGENERRRGIDRVNNTIGYLKENCISCCGICNMMKMKLTKEDFLSHIKKINDYNNL